MDKHILASYKEADKQTRAEITAYIDAIKDPQTQEMFRLHFVEGLSYSKLARQLGGGMTRYCAYYRVKRYCKRH